MNMPLKNAPLFILFCPLPNVTTVALFLRMVAEVEPSPIEPFNQPLDVLNSQSPQAIPPESA